MQSKALTRKEIQMMTRGADWKLFDRFLSERKEVLVTRLISCNIEEVKELQGQLKLINDLLRLPTTVEGQA